MKVILIYFKKTGKYYSEGEYYTKNKSLFEIWQEVREMKNNKKLPGLVEGANEFIISVDVPDHVNNHPHLIL